ncbi:MAG: DUF1501 domain-containing protein, partial [Gemmataceae bacterium]
MNPTRRDFLYGLGATLGTTALTSLVQAETSLAPRPPHHATKAKACVFLFLEGGPSHIDTFDPKPKLTELYLMEFVRNDKFASAMASGKRYFVESPFKFRQAGKSGLWMNEQFTHLAGVADELCLYKGCQAESVNHPTACYQMNTGSRFGADPAVGAWVSYGLGSANRDLPSFMVLPEFYFPQGGSANWSNGFLPASFQGTALRAQGAPILDLEPPRGVTREVQRRNLDLLAKLNDDHRQLHPEHEALAARMQAYELAFRMQLQVPGILDIDKEDARTKELYGIGDADTDNVGRRCLLAARLIEKGVRFVQVYAGGWDSHDYIERSHANRIRAVDKPFAGLIHDLKRRGLLDETLIVCAGEFGRSPDNGLRG